MRFPCEIHSKIKSVLRRFFKGVFEFNSFTETKINQVLIYIIAIMSYLWLFLDDSKSVFIYIFFSKFDTSGVKGLNKINKFFLNSSKILKFIRQGVQRTVFLDFF